MLAAAYGVDYLRLSETWGCIQLSSHQERVYITNADPRWQRFKQHLQAQDYKAVEGVLFGQDYGLKYIGINSYLDAVTNKVVPPELIEYYYAGEKERAFARNVAMRGLSIQGVKHTVHSACGFIVSGHCLPLPDLVNAGFRYMDADCLIPDLNAFFESEFAISKNQARKLVNYLCRANEKDFRDCVIGILSDVDLSIYIKQKIPSNLLPQGPLPFRFGEIFRGWSSFKTAAKKLGGLVPKHHYLRLLLEMHGDDNKDKAELVNSTTLTKWLPHYSLDFWGFLVCGRENIEFPVYIKDKKINETYSIAQPKDAVGLFKMSNELHNCLQKQVYVNDMTEGNFIILGYYKAGKLIAAAEIKQDGLVVTALLGNGNTKLPAGEELVLNNFLELNRNSLQEEWNSVIKPRAD